MSDPKDATQLSDEEIERRLAELETAIADEPSAKAAVKTPVAPTIDVDDPADATLDYLSGIDTPVADTSRAVPRSLPVAAEVVDGGNGNVASAARTPVRTAASMAATNPILERAIGVARFAKGYYDDIAADPNATIQAAVVVVIVAVATGFGGLRGGFDGFLAGVFTAIIKWGLISAAAWFIAQKLFPQANRAGGITPLARTLGYAQGPRILAIAGIVPILGWSISVVGTLWVVLTSVVAIRHTLKLSFKDAFATAILAWIVATVGAILIALLFGVGVGTVL